MKESNPPPVILLTGASAGLGLAIAKALLPTSSRLVLTARDASLPRFEELGIVESSRCWIRPLDVMNASQRVAVVDEINSTLGGLDVLINCAGFAYRAVMEHVEHDDFTQQLGTNFEGPMELIRLSLPRMRERRSGRIINISSVGGMMAMPTMGIYSASKFALEGATEALYYEVRPWNIKVTLVQPGFINSESFRNTRFTRYSDCAIQDPDGAYFGHYYFMGSFIEKLMRRSPATSEQVARTVLKVVAMKSPPLRVAGTPDALLFSLMRRLLPRGLYHWVLYNCLPKPHAWGNPERLKVQLEREKRREKESP